MNATNIHHDHVIIAFRIQFVYSTFFELTYHNDFRWKCSVSPWPFRTPKYFSPTNLFNLHISQVRQSLKYSSNTWRNNLTRLKLIDSIQSTDIRFMNYWSSTDIFLLEFLFGRIWLHYCNFVQLNLIK